MSTESLKKEDCDHSDVCLDELYCTLCDKDMSEELAAARFDREKDRRKYGE